MPMKYCDVMPGNNGTDVFVLHGYRAKVGDYKGLCTALNDAGCTVIDCEYIGHGKRVGNRHDMYETMKEIERVIRSRKNSVMLVGHSLGGGMALSIGSRLAKVEKVFAISAPNGAKFHDKGHVRKIQVMFFERFSDDDKVKFKKIMPMEYGECKAENKSKFYLVHSMNDSVVPFSEFEENKHLFCIPTRNTLVYKKINGIGVSDHIYAAYRQETVDFILKKIGK